MLSNEQHMVLSK